MRNAQALDFVSKLFGYEGGSGLVGHRQHDNKFFAAETGNEIARTFGRTEQRFRYLLKA